MIRERYRLLTFNPFLDRRGEEEVPVAQARSGLPLSLRVRAQLLTRWTLTRYPVWGSHPIRLILVHLQARSPQAAQARCPVTPANE